MASVTERRYWIEWMKQQHKDKYRQVLDNMPREEQKKIKLIARNKWARDNDVTSELRQLDKLKAAWTELNDKQTDNKKLQDELTDRVGDKKGLHRYQASNFLDEYRQAEQSAIQEAALKKAGIETLNPKGIEAVIMAATTSEQLMKAVEKLAAALGATIPSV